MSQALDFIAAPTPPLALPAPDEETRMIGESVRAFMDRAVLPRAGALEAGDHEALRTLFAEAASLGLTGLEVPERFGGLGLRPAAVLRVAAEVARQPSFAIALGAHVSIGTLPLALFGTEPLRARYLPDLASGARVAAYCLTEPEVGSDALAVRTRATLEGDHYRLDGAKQFVTNAGLAGLFTVFARVEGQGFTAFAVPAETPGVVVGAPEHKMSVRGSPTAPVIFEGARVPADHVIGPVGGGHRVAFPILTLGRLKLGFTAAGAAREALRLAAAYAAERRQCGRPIAEFELVRAKLAHMSARVGALEACCERLAAHIDAQAPAGLGALPPAGILRLLRDLDPLAALIKLLGSEVAGFVADEAVQIFGGYGVVEDYPVCGLYRDVRVYRVFEGTNEVNRLVLGGALLRRQRVDAAGPGGGDEPPRDEPPRDEPLCDALRDAIAEAARALAAMGQAADEAQQVLADLADLAVELFALDTLAATRASAPLQAVYAQGAQARLLGPLARLGARLGGPAWPPLLAAVVRAVGDTREAERALAVVAGAAQGRVVA